MAKRKRPRIAKAKGHGFGHKPRGPGHGEYGVTWALGVHATRNLPALMIDDGLGQQYPVAAVDEHGYLHLFVLPTKTLLPTNRHKEIIVVGADGNTLNQYQ